MSQDQQRTMVFNAISENDRNTEYTISEKLKLPLDKVRDSTDWLIRRHLVELKRGATIDNYGHELTEKGEAVYRTGKSVADALAELQGVTTNSRTHFPTTSRVPSPEPDLSTVVGRLGRFI